MIKTTVGGALPVSSINKQALNEPYVLAPFQEQGVDYIMAHKHCMLADDMGL